MLHDAEQGTDTLVYGVFQGDEVAFLPRQQALALAQLWRALDSAQTWGQFRRMVPPHIYDEVVAAVGDNENLADDGRPFSDAPFDRDDIPGHADGDWPALPARQMLDWMPQAVRERYGRVVSTRFNGDYLAFRARDATAVAEALQALGYTCVRDDDLVRDASGN